MSKKITLGMGAKFQHIALIGFYSKFNYCQVYLNSQIVFFIEGFEVFTLFRSHADFKAVQKEILFLDKKWFEVV